MRTAPSPDIGAAGADARALLRRVELTVARRLDGLMQGERRGRRPGPGSEPSITRPYEPGDDVRWVDWRLSARTETVMVRVPEIEPVLTAWALLDVSPSMAFGSAVRTKLELAREVLVAIGLILSRRNDRLGLIVTGGTDTRVVRPPRGDRRAMIALLSEVDRIRVDDATGARTDLAAGLGTVGAIARHRGLVVVISDFPAQSGLDLALGTLARRHEVIAIEIRDRHERELPPLGTIPLRDVETGRVRLVDTSDPRFRERYRRVVEADATERRALFARAGVRHVALSSERDWVMPLANALGQRAPRRLGS
ncbi:MAG: DUF58 domain-containing protein [Actinobacteria bacterium]|nr:DUF58 domain-containing protein [Actinomycetota bacterium]